MHDDSRQENWNVPQLILWGLPCPKVKNEWEDNRCEQIKTDIVDKYSKNPT